MSTPTLKAAAAYFAVVFTLGFVLGALSVTVFGSSPAAFFTGLATPAGMSGLAGQVVFGLWPWWQGRSRP